MRRYAEGTSVAVPRSRKEIETLLRAWGVQSVSWADDYSTGGVSLRFVWTAPGQLEGAVPKRQYIARFDLPIKQEGSERQILARTREAHRLLLLWVKAALNAIEAGLVSAEAIFLPFIEGPQGATVAETLVQRLHLFTEGKQLLLGDGGAVR